MIAALKLRSLPSHAELSITSKQPTYSTRIGRLAEDDLLRAALWYAERHTESDSPFQKTFREALDVLGHFPLSGRTRPDLRPDLRSFAAHPFLIFYRVDESRKTVTVLRVLHGRMDLDPSETDDFG